jgi:hypothetical protein
MVRDAGQDGEAAGYEQRYHGNGGGRPRRIRVRGEVEEGGGPSLLVCVCKLTLGVS